MKLAIHLTYPHRPLPFPAVLGAIHTLAWLPGGTGETGGTGFHMIWIWKKMDK